GPGVRERGEPSGRCPAGTPPRLRPWPSPARHRVGSPARPATLPCPHWVSTCASTTRPTRPSGGQWAWEVPHPDSATGYLRRKAQRPPGQPGGLLVFRGQRTEGRGDMFAEEFTEERQRLWAQARCSDGAGTMVALFFSEQLDD